jgi:hypothetical protein
MVRLTLQLDFLALSQILDAFSHLSKPCLSSEIIFHFLLNKIVAFTTTFKLFEGPTHVIKI